MAERSFSTLYELADAEKEFARGMLAGASDSFGSLMLGGGSLYIGGITGGSPAGYGAVCLNNGTRYEGAWANGMRHGEGRLISSDGTTEPQLWENGNRVGISPAAAEPRAAVTQRTLSMPAADGEGFRASAAIQLLSMRRLRRGNWNENAIHFSDGYYIGEVKKSFRDRRYEEIPNGHGFRLWDDGVCYDGEWSDGRREGYGILLYTDGSVYEGGWHDDEMHGSGTLTESNGASISGTWNMGRKPAFATNEEYAASVAAAAPEPAKRVPVPTEVPATENAEAETLTYDDGRYEGETYNGMPQGRGRRFWDNGDVYEGEWLRGNRHGDGVMTYAAGGRYAGMWKNDMRHGSGKFTTPEGEEISGIWMFDKRTADGGGTSLRDQKITTDPIMFELGSYSGELSGGVPNGDGKMRYKTGDFYKGGFLDGEKSGYGVMEYNNGSVYAGQWKYDLRHGSGTFTDANGKKTVGIWRSGALIKN